MNALLKNAAKTILKNLLVQCTDDQQMMFKRMYCHKNLELSINEAVDQMKDDKIDWAITQTERTVEKRGLKRRVLIEKQLYRSHSG